MKKSFMTRALAMGLSLAMAFSLSAATNVSVASAAATPAMASKQFAVRVGGAAKSYKASAATQKSFKITKATVGNTDKATVKVNSSKKSIKVTPGTVTGTTVVKVTFKNIKTAKTTAKKYRCVVKAAIEDKEPEKPVEEAKATKITEAKASTAKTATVTFDGVVDTSTATAIKLERGTTAITVTAKYADDKKSVLLTSDTAFAAGTYTVTVGSLAPVSFNVVKQTPTKLNITNTTIANSGAARVYFQVLDQYGEVMENYTDKKLTVRAYNATKGHNITQGPDSKKDYFTLNCATETVDVVTAGALAYLNAVGDKISIVAYLTDNAGVSCAKELEIVRVYGTELTFGDIKLADDKRVTVNRAYEIDYVAKDNEGNEYKFDEKQKGVNATAATVVIGNYNFISSNISAVDMTNVSVDSNGKLHFVAGTTAGTSIITAINTITGETSTITIVVNNTAKLSSMEIADASVAWNASANATLGATGATTFKAAVTAYDQFGEVLDPKDVKNVVLATNAIGGGYVYDSTYFNSITPTPVNLIVPVKITSDGKYVQYQVVGSLSGMKNQNIRFDFVSAEMGETGYIRSTATVSVDDETEAAALEIIKKPDATVSENRSVSVQFAVKDQYQNKMTLTTAPAISSGGIYQWAAPYVGVGGAGEPAMGEHNSYVVKYECTNGIVSHVAIKAGDDDKVYKMEFTAPLVTGRLKRTGTFTLKLMDGMKVIASETFDLTAVESIDRYCVKTDKDKYKAGDKIQVEVDAYSNNRFNSSYNASSDVVITTKNTTPGYSGNSDYEKVYSKTLKFVNGTATFEIPAGKKAANYWIKVQDKNAQPTCAAPDTALADSSKYEVVENSAAKFGVDSIDGKLKMQDSQGNDLTPGYINNTFATIKVMDATTNTDITGGRKFNGTPLNADNTLPVSILANGKVNTIGGDYTLGGGIEITDIPVASRSHNITLSITIGDMTWSTTIEGDGSNRAVFVNQDAAQLFDEAFEDALQSFGVVTGASFTNVSVTNPATGSAVFASDLTSVWESAEMGTISRVEASGTSGISTVAVPAVTVTAGGITVVIASPAAIMNNNDKIVIPYTITLDGTSDDGSSTYEFTFGIKIECKYVASGNQWSFEIKEVY